MKPEHYVNNREFTTAVSDWVRKRKQAVEEGTEPLPPIPDFVGECFTKIARRYALKPNWSSCSSYIDDMISEAVLSCVKYAHNFNPDKSKNAFAYFTQCCHHSFLQYINREKKIAKFKFDMVKEANPELARMDYNNIKLYDEDQEYDPDNPDLSAKTEVEEALEEENADIASQDLKRKDEEI